MKIPAALREELIAHALEDAPNECCGMVGTRDGTAVRVYRAENEAASPLRYEIAAQDQLRIYNAIEDDELDLGIVYHSHTRSAPVPSQTDINLATWPDALYVIIGVEHPDAPEVRGWWIRDGGYEEADLEVV